MQKSILIVAGETSGDNLGSEIISEWKTLNGKSIKFWGFGGEKLRHAEVEILRDIHDLSVIGFWEGLTNYTRLKKYMDDLILEAGKRKICAAILIDYPGFNLKLAEQLFAMNIPVYQVVSPQLWAWHYSRIYKIQKYIKEIFCLYKFEVNMYLEKDISAKFIGHPVIQKVNAFNKQFAKEIKNIKKENVKNIKVALLPGSRLSEIKRHMPFLIEVAQEFHRNYPQTIFEIPSASTNITLFLKQYVIPDYIFIRENDAYLTMATADSGVVCSGTATLECAVFQLPFLLIYKTSWLSYLIGKRLIQIPYIGLVNVLHGKFVTKEFIQKDMDKTRVMKELEKINFDDKYIKKMKKDFLAVKTEIFSKNPARNAAQFLSKILK